MKKKFKKSLFIFRRDLRVIDNTALIAASEESSYVLPIFIFDPNQISNKNKYRSFHAIQFMIESLINLEKQLKEKKGRLYIFRGYPEKIVKKIIKEEKIEAVFVNRDYTPYSNKRDKKIKKVCDENNISFESHNDLLLHEPEEIYTIKKEPYKIFTPFFNKAKKIQVRKPQKKAVSNFYKKKISFEVSSKIYKKILSKKSKTLYVSGGRSNCTKIIKNLSKFKNYSKTRDLPEYDTTLLSAHIKFGTYSIREIYYAIRKKLSAKHLLIRQLYWRDFFTHIAFHFPYVFGKPFYKKYNNLDWKNNKNDFKLWCKGKTGFPIVDAGIRQMNKSGFMHNRVRMIVASFLVKDLHINWLWGEKYFAQTLVDYDPSVNNGNWQWCASTGADAQPYFRIFNPWLQQKKFDSKCVYIKKWIPELKNIDPKIIHNWYNQIKQINDYPLPIRDHKKEAEIAKKEFKKVIKRR